MHEKPFKGRSLTVQISDISRANAKRHATTIIGNRERSTASPSLNGDDAALSPKSNAEPPSHTGKDRFERTLALMNIPDTVNDARIRVLTEPHGPLVKIVLRPDHQGVIIEYADVAAAGKASLQLDGHEIVPGRRIRVGSVPEMLKQNAEHRTDKIGSGPAKKKEQAKQAEGSSNAHLQPPGPIRRPNQAGGRRGGRGGLGQKSGNSGLSGRGTLNGSNGGHDVEMNGAEGGAEGGAGAGTGGAKSNDDFRNLLLRGKEK